MSDQPKPIGYFGPAFDAELKPKPTTGEWTRNDVYNHTVDDIVAAHNAALAASQDRVNSIIRDYDNYLAAYKHKSESMLDTSKRVNDKLREKLAAKDHEWNLARLTDIKELTDKHAQQLADERDWREQMIDQLETMHKQLAAERELLYRIGRRMMESQATGEPLNLDLLRSEIDAILYPPKTPEKFA